VPDLEAMADLDPGSDRRSRLAAARLYLVCGGDASARGLERLLGEAVGGGVDIVQLRAKDRPETELLALARTAASVCRELGALFIVNDSPAVARESGADGVHVGQDDITPAAARAIVGRELLIGLSTHEQGEVDAADPELVDYIGVGPVHETPTKPGRPAVGLELVRHAAAHARVPFFAIGGLNAGNLGEALSAGAMGVCVLRAIGDARDPRAAARALAEQLGGVAAGERA